VCQYNRGLKFWESATRRSMVDTSHFRTQAKVWSNRFYWPKMHEDNKRNVASCLECQRTGNIS
jgi:hypothetical protein